MPRYLQTQPSLHQLRYFFRHSAPLLYYVPNPTAGDVAEIWSKLSDQHAEAPVGVAVSVANAAIGSVAQREMAGQGAGQGAGSLD